MIIINVIFHIISILGIILLAIDSFSKLFRNGAKSGDKLGLILSIILGKIIYIIIAIGTIFTPVNFYSIFIINTTNNTTNSVNWKIWGLLVLLSFGCCFFYERFIMVNNTISRRLLVAFLTTVFLFLGHSYIISLNFGINSNGEINLNLLPFLGLTTGVLIYLIFNLKPSIANN